MAKFIKSGRQDVGVYFDKFNGEDVLHIRKCYTNKEGQRGRTAKGVMLTPEAARDLFAALGEVLTAGPTGVDPFTATCTKEKPKPKRKAKAKAKA